MDKFWKFMVDGETYAWKENAITRAQIIAKAEDASGKTLRYKILDENHKVIEGLKDFPSGEYFNFADFVKNENHIVSFEFYGQASVS